MADQTHIAEIVSQGGWWAAVAAIGAAIWRGLTVARAVGRLEQEVRGLRSEVSYVRQRLDKHLDAK